MNLTITGYSTALFSTWFFVDDWALLLDCGDGAVAGLLQKSRKVRTIAVSHADRDHLNGLPQFLQINSRERGLPVVLYPRDCGSFPALEAFLKEFDRREEHGVSRNQWLPVVPGDSHPLGKAKARVLPVASRHIDTEPGLVKSLSYLVVNEHNRLRPEYAGLSEAEIVTARHTMGDAAVMETVSETLLAYSADTPIEPADRWQRPKILIHESTFLHVADAMSRAQEMRHSALDQVLPMAADLPLEALILSHFSTRYGAGEIRRAIREGCHRIRPSFPVFAVLPGEIRRDILAGRPVWEP